MAICPYCGHQVIEGDDVCSECQHSLVDLHLPEPASAVEKALLTDRVAELHPNNPLCVEAATLVGTVLKTMADQNVGCLLVTEDDQLVGIFSERDALRKIGANVEDCVAQPVSAFMTKAPRTLPSNAKVAFALHRMDLGGFRHLPVTGDAGEPVGVISVRDILRYLASLSTAD